jgi:hypothetical protein
MELRKAFARNLRDAMPVRIQGVQEGRAGRSQYILLYRLIQADKAELARDMRS